MSSEQSYTCSYTQLLLSGSAGNNNKPLLHDVFSVHVFDKCLYLVLFIFFTIKYQ